LRIVRSVKPRASWRIMMRFAAAAIQLVATPRWQAFCLAKQGSIRYTANWMSHRKARDHGPV